MIKKKRKNTLGPTSRDPKKDRTFRLLAVSLESAGFTVRREKLKSGPGWRAFSGWCRHQNNDLVFVDSRMPQDDQIEFLVEAHLVRNIVISPDQAQDLPEPIVARLTAQSMEAPAA
ncbi:MAG: hypothetical protein KDD53_08035 [Bdellovibrionales bacterium]|nr:hypothetical protein [Bdellovibrionales bacterium]